MGHTLADIKNPGSLKISSSKTTLFIAMAVIGLLALAGGIMLDAKRGWSSLLLNHFFFMCLGLGGIFIAAIQWLTSAMWSAPIRRISESFTAYLPLVFLGFIAIAFGIPHIFEWSHPEIVKGDLMLEHKASYLNVTFFIIRNLIAIALWVFFSKKMVGNSIAQDANGDISYTNRNKVLAPIFLIVFALSFTMSSFDLLMSLDPHWFSTMFGVYCFAGLFYSSLALTAIITVLLKRQGHLEGIVNDNHLHDLGKFMFAFTIFWAYIGFCQFMLIWYANMPEETMYFMHRMENKWIYVTVFLFFAKFMVPFFALLPRAAKRSESRLLKVGIWMLFAQWIDLLWLIQPEFFKEGARVGWIEVAGFVGFGGLFCLMVSRFLSKHNIVAIKDPKLVESVYYHHQ
jgi:hypothetical protein